MQKKVKRNATAKYILVQVRSEWIRKLSFQVSMKPDKMKLSLAAAFHSFAAFRTPNECRFFFVIRSMVARQHLPSSNWHIYFFCAKYALCVTAAHTHTQIRGSLAAFALTRSCFASIVWISLDFLIVPIFLCEPMLHHVYIVEIRVCATRNGRRWAYVPLNTLNYFMQTKKEAVRILMWANHAERKSERNALCSFLSDTMARPTSFFFSSRVSSIQLVRTLFFLYIFSFLELVYTAFEFELLIFLLNNIRFDVLNHLLTHRCIGYRFLRLYSHHALYAAHFFRWRRV